MVSKSNDDASLSHMRSNCKYHIVFIPKYLRKVIYGKLRVDKAISSFMGYLKGKSSLMIFEKHANLKYKDANRNFWTKGYYVSTVGLVDEYIRKKNMWSILREM
ncbi:IS200/IS605 family transposase [Mannheimia massilioguelmaensis]|uniref:IS200/IS605 family transposase n=1 Tax=Mannheimia massilioguelmaensis TaxID=1604354 RepID=UPI0005CB24BF|nr:IS200/IS605 family transposase [Mannheimia massilioguelmaensis]